MAQKVEENGAAEELTDLDDVSAAAEDRHTAGGADGAAAGAAETAAPAAAGAAERAKPDRRKSSPSISYPPYVNAYGAIPKLFAAIQGASVPTKFTQDFLESVLEMKSTSHRALIPLLKRLGLLDQANVPTERYRRIRDPEEGPPVLAEQIRAAYADLYRANEYAHRLGKSELTTKLRSVLGASADDPNVGAVVGTFTELCKLADFEAPAEERDRAPARERPRDPEREDEGEEQETRRRRVQTANDLGISYTINLNLPATTDIQVFNAIFKSLREHILGDG